MKLLVGLILLVTLAQCWASVLEVLRSPKSVQLPEKETTEFFLSEVPLVISQILGLSAEKPDGWTGKGDLLDRPECAAVFVLTIKDHLRPDFGSKFKYPLIADESPNFGGVLEEVKSAFANQGTWMNVSRKIEGAHGDELPFKIADEVVKTKIVGLREELSNMKAVAAWLDTNPEELKNGVPDLFLFKMEGLVKAIPKDLQKSQYSKDKDTQEASKEVLETINELSERLLSVYSGNCFIGLVTQDSEHRRAKRDTATQTGQEVPGLYDFYKPDYPVAFNIILWTMVFISLTVLFVSVGMWFIDPGKDSIIYRMTMQRAKKD